MMEFIILALATWRLSSLLTEETGPGDIFLKIRELAGITHMEKEVYEIPEKFLPELLSCIWCASIWIAILITVSYLLYPHVTVAVCMPFALSAATIFLQNNKYS